MLDDVDKKILLLLQENCTMSNSDIAKQLQMAPSGIFERIRKLEKRGIILGYEARVNTRAAGFGLLAFMYVKSTDRAGEMKNAKALSKIPEVLEVHHIAGEDCYLLKIRARDTDDLARILRESIGSIKTILSTKTTIVFETIKETAKLPLQKDDTLS